ncbi:Decarboxylase [Lachnellula willkommii]|uniref:6-methylsalicylate decarboxylase n=1 Tax=Lachnellula willkommii TaxID=215461 RepID=A0A559MMI8_9HELO|nr:Decarboxylase [Lachnellula willkommii]
MSLEVMTRLGIGTSILSCAIPTSVVTKDAAEEAALSREINEYLASLRDQHPSQFGFFATVPSLSEDVQGCIDEIRYAYSTLKADGVALFTSYSDKYLGHPAFEPVWAELNSHVAVVFIHPTMESNDKAIKEPFLIPRALFDWSHEVTRTAMHLIMTGAVRRFSACKVILSHGGGTLPFVANRIADVPIQTRLSGKTPAEFIQDARSFYFDTALVGHKAPLRLLMSFAQRGHVLWGSDYPFVREDPLVQKSQTIDAVEVGAWERAGMEDEGNEEIDRDRGLTLPVVTRQAAQALFPRFADPDLPVG